MIRTAEQAERRAAENDLQEAIERYLKKAAPTNRCGSYTKAAAKYLESATLLGMNIEDEFPIAQHFNQLVDECSFVFTVETRVWINHPKRKEKMDHRMRKNQMTMPQLSVISRGTNFWLREPKRSGRR